ncbi:MAG: hypothetical protein AAGM29_20035 [Cyanobacteria bacterium J06588_4]
MPPIDKVPQIVKSIWSNSIYQKWSGSGTTAERRLPNLIPLGRRMFMAR